MSSQRNALTKLSAEPQNSAFKSVLTMNKEKPTYLNLKLNYYKCCPESSPKTDLAVIKRLKNTHLLENQYFWT